MDVVVELERGDVVIEAALRTRPDVAVLDIDMPGLDGLGCRPAARVNSYPTARTSCSRV